MNFLRDLVDLSKIIVAYLWHPLLFVEVFLPHSRLVLWWTQRKPFDKACNIPNLSDKVVLITGGNAGLGAETVYRLAQHNPRKIYLASRSRDKGRASIEQIRQRLQLESGLSAPAVPPIEHLMLDLTDLISVKTAAMYVMSREERLDILVLNAGIMGGPSAMSSFGYEIQLSTNYIGHFLLTKLLLPLLEHTARSVGTHDVRIVTVSSEAFHIAPGNCVDLITTNHELLCKSSPFTRYGVSKAANILFAAELARRYNGVGVTSVSLHPGVILTNLYSAARTNNPFVHLGLPLIADLFFDDVSSGALNQIWCAASARNHELENGAYYTPVGIRRPNIFAADRTASEKLWMWTDTEMKRLGVYD